MYTIKNIYFRDLLTDLHKKRVIVVLFIIISTLVFAFLGYQKVGVQTALSEEQQEEIDAYNKRLEEYDKAIADASEGVKLSEEQVLSLQEYVDNSIYMKLDSQNIQVASIQYGIVTEGNVGNIYNALAYYINEGGLKEALDDENLSLDIKYWREIIFPSLSGNVMNITIYHYDAEQAQKVMDILKERLLAQIPSIAEIHGGFSLQETDAANYVKADVNVANTQNGNLNNLKNYITSRSDYNNRVISQENGKKSYIESSTPEVLEPAAPNGIIIVIKYMIAGILFGIVIPCVYFILSYILGNRILSKDGLKEYNLAIIGQCSSKGHYHPELDRTIMDLKLLTEQNGWNSVFLNVLNANESIKKVVSEYKEALAKTNISSSEGCQLENSAEELRQLVEIKNCILFIQISKTTYPQLEEQINLCKKFGVAILGCVVVG
jgi:hypothetical protein